MRHDFARFLNIRSALNPVLAPDNGRLAYLTDVTGNYQVWSVGTRGDGTRGDGTRGDGTRGDGKARVPRQLTFLPDKVWEVHGTSAAGHLLAVSDAGGNERQQFYLVSNFGVDAQGRDAHDVRRLTTDDDAIHEFGAWSRDGQQIVYTSNARNGTDFDVYRMDVASARSTLLRESRGWRNVRAWSPDGGAILLTDEVSSLEVDLYCLDVASGDERSLTAGRPPARYDQIHWTPRGLFAISDAPSDRGALCRIDPASGEISVIFDADDEPGRGEMELFAAAADGRTAAVAINVGGYSHLFLVDLEKGRRQRIDALSQGVIGSMRFSARGDFLVVSYSTPVAPADIWSVRVVDGSCRQLTYSNGAGIDASTFVAPRIVDFATFDGRSISALLYLPQETGREPVGGLPCILYVHGGPASQHRPEFFVSFQYFLQHGFAVLAPNVRGSTGYGRAWTELDEVERRMDSVADLRAAMAWIALQPGLDPRRVAVYGRSYGGFMVLAALAEYPDDFAAGIDVVGISNWVTFLERTGPWRRSHREREYGSLERDRRFLESISPIHKVDRIRAPLLVIAGDNDPRVPLSESEQIVERIAASGGHVEFLHYADEGHIFSKLENRIDSFTQIAEFLHRTLGPR